MTSTCAWIAGLIAITVRELRNRLGFEVDLSHLSVGGWCGNCVVTARDLPR